MHIHTRRKPALCVSFACTPLLACLQAYSSIKLLPTKAASSAFLEPTHDAYRYAYCASHKHQQTFHGNKVSLFPLSTVFRSLAHISVRNTQGSTSRCFLIAQIPQRFVLHRATPSPTATARQPPELSRLLFLHHRLFLLVKQQFSCQQ